MAEARELAETFREIADLLDLEGVRFKPEAYRRAARSLEALTEDLRAIAARGGLRSIPGVGEAIADKIQEYLREGRVHHLETLRGEVPPGLIEIMHLPGFGPKTARRLWVELGVEGPRELESALAAHRLDGLAGFGPRKIELLATALQGAGAPAARRPLRAAWETARTLVAALAAGAPVDRVEVAGSLRRRRETVGDLDILATSTVPERVFDVFSALPEVRAVRMRGGTKETVELSDGLQVDLRVVEPAAFGAALQYFTGSKDHNVHLRSIARERGLKVNEYGVFRGEDRIAGASEAEVYGALGLPLIPPEIREDHGEIEAAAAGRLPKLVEEKDLRGHLHAHLDRIGGPAGIPAAVEAARRLGWGYLGLVVPESEARSLPALRRSLPREGADDPRVLLGVEGGPAPAAPPPAGADYRVARATGEEGPDAPPGDGGRGSALFVGHLATGSGTGEVDPARVGSWVRWAASSGVALEVTPAASADGLDSAAARRAAEAGVALLLGPGDLGPSEWDRVALAVGLARRGWVTPDRVLNARPWAEVARRPARRPGPAPA